MANARTTLLTLLAMVVLLAALSLILFFRLYFPEFGYDLVIISSSMIIDLGVLLLILYEDFGRPFFSRPIPKISSIVMSFPHQPYEQINLMGININLFQITSIELWMNVTNLGKTAIKRMRARAKFAVVPKKIPFDRTKPEGMSDEQWSRMKAVHDQFEKEFNERISSSLFGKPLPFVNTPKGTAAFPWTEADGKSTFETDLSPNSDEASVRLIALYPLGERGRLELEKAGKIKTQPGTQIIATQIANNSGLSMGTTSDMLMYDLIVKFWIIAENLTREHSSLFHIEIFGHDQGIICTKISPRDKMYPKVFEMLQV
jgi:hypothetical protein